jgi:hypothetical protein
MAILLPSLALADKKASADGRKSESKALPASLYGEARSGKCVACSASTPAGRANPDGLYPAWMSPHPMANHPSGYGAFGDELRHQLLWDQHECAPDGCIKPLGCGNLWTEIKFVFGSCRQFFGTAESTVGHHRNTRDRFATPYR